MTTRIELCNARLGSKKYRCIMGTRIYDGGMPPARGKQRKQKNHVNRYIARENIRLRRSLGDVDPQLVVCASGDFGRSRVYKRKHGWKPERIGSLYT